MKIKYRNKQIGEVKGDIFELYREDETQQLFRPPAWAINISAIHQAQAAGAVMIHIHYAKDNSDWWKSINEFLTEGTEDDRGHGKQVYLQLHKWHKGKDRPLQQMSLL